MYITFIPKRFVLASGKVVELKAIDVEKGLVEKTLFRLWVPNIDDLYRYLIELQGFESAIPSFPRGERYSLRKVLGDVWELHLRLYSDGFIDAEIEIRREYLEHIAQSKRINVVYEPYEFYREFYDKLHVFYVPENDWIVRIEENFQIKLREPSTLTPWKPIVVGAVFVGLLTYALYRLARGSEQ